MAIGGLLLGSDLTDTAVPGLVFMGVGAFALLVAAVAYGTRMAQREAQRTLTATETVSLLRYLTAAGDPEQRRLRPIAEGLGLRLRDARRVVEGAVDAAVIAEDGASGRYELTATGLQLLEAHGA